MQQESSQLSARLPHRLRESSFRKFEPTLRAAVERFPSIVTINCGHSSPLTISARLRDAKMSLRKYEWVTDIDMAKFIEIYDNIVVSHRGTTVLCGGRDELKRYDPQKPILPETFDIEQIDAIPCSEVFKLSREEIRLCCVFASKHLFNRAILFTGIGDPLSEEEVANLEENFDARIDKNQDGTFTLT